jgi:hypothetical protein
VGKYYICWGCLLRLRPENYPEPFEPDLEIQRREAAMLNLLTGSLLPSGRRFFYG